MNRRRSGLKTLVTGGTGRLGTEVVKAFAGCLAPGHADLDITDAGQVDKYIAESAPTSSCTWPGLFPSGNAKRTPSWPGGPTWVARST